MGLDFIQDNWIDFKDAITYFIDNDTYIHVMLDQYYTPNTPAFEKTHFLYDLLIIGYDQERDTINFAQFSEYGKYTKF